MHRDILGKEIKIGSWIATPGRSSRVSLVIGKVTKISPKMLTVVEFSKSRGYQRYPHDVIVIDELEDLTVFALKGK